jgi:hypothetical protein
MLGIKFTMGFTIYQPSSIVSKLSPIIYQLPQLSLNYLSLSINYLKVKHGEGSYVKPYKMGLMESVKGDQLNHSQYIF